jgi:pimeloyl-ACP methyl ester carboxylesterase
MDQTTTAQYVCIGNRRLAVQVRGQGPVVVLEVGVGAGGIGFYWSGVDARLAEFCRVVVYDRAGLGGSDAAQPRPTARDRAQDLAALLDALEIHGPVILAGWSFGGLIIENFAARFPERVDGLLLIDPTPPDQFTAVTAAFPRWQRALMHSRLALLPSRAMLLAARLGLLKTRGAKKHLRQMLASAAGPGAHPESLDAFVEFMTTPAAHRGTLMEVSSVFNSCQDTQALLAKSGLPPVPLIVLSALYRGKRVSPRIADFSERLRQSHQRTAAMSPQGEFREVPDVGHNIPDEAPEAIVGAVRDLLARMRAS